MTIMTRTERILEKEMEMAISENRDYRAFVSFEVRAAEKKEDEEYIVEGYATTFDDPYVLYDDGTYRINEQISKDAFEEADMSDVLFLYNHEGRVYARQKNGSLELTVDKKGLHVKANLGLTEEARKMYEDIKAGLVDQMSWAFTVKEDSWDRESHTRTITKVKKVYDVSAVSYPANPSTEISARSYADGVISAEKAERLENEQKMALARKKYEYLEG